MDLDSILAKAGVAPAAPSAALDDDAPPSFLQKRPSGGMDLDSILRKAGAHPDDEEVAPSGPDRIGAANAAYNANAQGLATDAAAIPTLGQQARQIPILGSILKGNDVATGALVHPVDTLNALRGAPLQNAREAMRGVNDNIPFANRAVQAMGGPAAESAEDQAAAIPGMRDFGGLAGMPAASMVGGIAARGIEAAAPVVSKALSPAADVAQGIGKRAQDFQAARAEAGLEMGTAKRTRAGVRTDAVRDAIAETPELRRAAASGDLSETARVTTAVRQGATRDLRKIYGEARVAPDALATPIENMDARASALKASDVPSNQAAGAALEKIRDKLNRDLSTEGAMNPLKLREIQSDFQRKSYGKVIPGTPGAEEANAQLWANAEASKAVGDAVVRSVTGMDYEAAKASAAANPDGLAARLFKANDRITAANRLDAAIAEKAAKPAPRVGFAKLVDKAKHPLHTAVDAGAAVPAAMGRKAVDVAARLADIRAGKLNIPARAIGEGASWAGDIKPVTPPAQPQRPAANPAAVVALIRAARSGATRQELHAQAEQAGVPVEIADNIAQQNGR